MNTLPHLRNVLTHAGRLITALTVFWLHSAAAAVGDFEAHTDIGTTCDIE
jgi:hypothetical protein